MESELALAQRLHQAGDLSGAEVLYRQILGQQPEHAPALGGLGLIAFQQGQHAEAIDLLRQACALAPDEASLASNLGLAYKSAGRLSEAIGSFRQAIEKAPQFAEAHANLGSALKDAEQLPEAIAHLRRAVELQPHHPVMVYTLGNVLQQEGNFKEALACYETALARQPNFPAAWNNRGSVLQKMGRRDDARASYSTALQHQPNFVDALINLGLLHQEEGERSEAAALWRRAAQLAPGRASIHRDLGNLLQELGQWHAAAASLETAIQLEATHAETHNSLALALTKLGQLEKAASHCREALRLRPDYAEAHNNLGAALIEQGLVREAIAGYRAALQLQPAWHGAHSNVLLALNYLPEAEPEWLCAQHEAWGRSFPPSAVSLSNLADPDRRLRIGYVSPDLRLHPVAHFLEPVLLAHDRQNFEVYAYADVISPDPMTEKLRRLTDGWRATSSLADERFVEQVRRDQIDILVDLTGHTGNNRLPALARRAAPVQVSWLGYPNTTGLGAMDYRLTDAVADPPGEPRCHSEMLIRLPGCFCCFAPPTNFPPVTPLPARQRGQITFGSFHNLAKIHAGVVDLWSEVLRSVPGSRLLMFRNTLHGGTADRLRQLFLERGIEPERLDFRSSSAGDWGYLRLYHDMDMVLDTWPWSGHTTTCEGLWMGVPALALPGNRHAGRMTASILTQLKMTDWIASGSTDFVRRAAHWANALDQLAALRQGLREQMRQSPLCNGPEFTSSLQHAYRQIWRTWCTGQMPTANTRFQI